MTTLPLLSPWIIVFFSFATIVKGLSITILPRYVPADNVIVECLGAELIASCRGFAKEQEINMKLKKNKNFTIENINFEDQKVFDLLSNGNTVGLFQLESSGMREALMQMKPNHLEDNIALVALYRPGPMSNIPTYNDCKHGKQSPDYLHPY